MDKPTQVTSVQVPSKLFEEFRILSIRTKINFNKLVERSLYLYVTNNDFKKQINNQLDTFFTGSNNN